MIANIVDARTNAHAFAKINAVIEPSCHDNSVVGATQVEWTDELIIDELSGVSLAEAIAWANAFAPEVTLYLYDEEVAPLG